MAVVSYGTASPDYIRLADLFQAEHYDFERPISSTTAFVVTNVDNTYVRYGTFSDEGELENYSLDAVRYGGLADPFISWNTADGSGAFLIADLEAFHEAGEASAVLIMSGNDTITGGSSENYLEGYAGKDVLDGADAADILWGGLGKDSLKGGLGKDVFDFNDIAESTFKASGRDIILDFSHKQKDKIDLDDIDANENKKKDQDFKFIGDDHFHKKAGEVMFDIKAGDTFVYGDTDGNGKADFAIQLDGAIHLKAGDFLL